jgi:hypothetical protein
MTLIPYRIHKKVGYCLPDKTMVIKARFDVAMPFIHEFAWVKVGNLWGVLNKDGSFHIEPKYEWDSDHDFFHVWQYTILAVKSNGKYGYMIDYQEIIPTIYELPPHLIYTFVYDLPSAHILYDLFRVKNKEGFGFVNDRHELVMPFEMPDATGNIWIEILHSSVWFCKEKEIKNYKTNQRFSIPSEFDNVFYFVEKLNLFCGRKVIEGAIFYGLFDANGLVVLAPLLSRLDVNTEYPNFFYFQKENDLIGLLSMDLKEIVPPVYTQLTHIQEGVFCAYKTGFIGLINLKNEEISIPKPSENAQIIEINYYLRYVVFMDDTDYFITNLEGHLLVAIAKNDFREEELEKTLFTGYQWAFENSYYLITKNRTYIFDFTNWKVITIDLPVQLIRLYDETYVAIKTEDSDDFFLYNLKTGKRDYPFFVFRKWPDRDHYLINKTIHESGTRTKIGAIDKNEKITVPIGKHKGWQGIGHGVLEQFAILKHKNDYSEEAWDYYYWVDMVRNIVYAENLPKSK